MENAEERVAEKNLVSLSAGRKGGGEELLIRLGVRVGFIDYLRVSVWNTIIGLDP